MSVHSTLEQWNVDAGVAAVAGSGAAQSGCQGHCALPRVAQLDGSATLFALVPLPAHSFPKTQQFFSFK